MVLLHRCGQRVSGHLSTADDRLLAAPSNSDTLSMSHGQPTKIGQGREAAKQYLIDNPKVLAEIDKKVRAAALV